MFAQRQSTCSVAQWIMMTISSELLFATKVININNIYIIFETFQYVILIVN